MIVTIDGPAGAGKSSAARSLADRLGFRFLDTGAMYRAVTLAAIRNDHDWSDEEELARLAHEIDIQLGDDTVLVNGEDVTRAIRTSNVTPNVHYAAGNAAVREHLVSLQRREAAGQNVVSEGRDQGTVVFPKAECKIFLTASPEERARRRLQELHARGESVDYDEVLEKQNLRDQRDTERACGPLIKAADAIEVITDQLNADEVVDRLENLVRSKMSKT